MEVDDTLTSTGGPPIDASSIEDTAGASDGDRTPSSRDGDVQLGETLDEYRLERLLGKGGMGRVFEARNLQTDVLWALKLLECGDPASLLRFKREFRAVANVVHENLVRLGELHVLSPTQAYITMELIRGRPFVEWVRRGTPAGSLPNLLRLRRAMRQLVLGVERLHHEGCIHRDIKPSNVLISDEGRVVILDFGLIREAGLAEQTLTGAGQALGTPLYMAPEQAGDGEVGPAADWYAVGVMLFECLTGHRPFVGSTMQILLAKQQQDAPDPAIIVPDLPEPLRDLCLACLAREPEQRPGAKQLIEHFGEGEGEASGSFREGSHFVGRERELDRLRVTLDRVRTRREAARVWIAGSRGIGKSALLHRFARELEREGAALVLRCRCIERETLPFKGIDGLVDALSLTLRRLSENEAAALRPRRLAALARLFPTLADVWSSYSTDLGDSSSSGADAVLASGEPRELLRRGVAALRELLGRLARRRPLVLMIDDFQWADDDSARLLIELLRPPDPPALVLLLSHRPDRRAGAAVELLTHAPALATLPTSELRLDPLEPADAEALVRSLLPAHPARAEHDEAKIELLLEFSRGNPLLLTQFARSEPMLGSDAAPERQIMPRILGLPPDGRRVLEYIAVAGGPLPQTLLEELLPATTLPARLIELGDAGLIRREVTAPHATTLVDASHERVRELILAELTPEDLRLHHRSLAKVLEDRGADPEAIAEHWEQAGEPARALVWAERAARRAAEHLAFARSVASYRRALRLLGMLTRTGDRVGSEDLLRAELAEQLIALGDAGEAADILLGLAESADSEQASLLRRRAARLRFASGRFREAMQLSAEQLASVGETLPRSKPRALLMLVWNRLLLRLRPWSPQLRLEAMLPSAELARLEILQSYVAAAFVNTTEPTLDAVALRARLLRLALAAGEPSRIAYSLAGEARILAWLGETKRATALLRRVSELPLDSTDPTLAPLVRYLEASAYIGAQAWPAASARLDELQLMLAWEIPGTGWLRPHLIALRSYVRLMNGRLAELRDSIGADAALMAELDDSYNNALLVWSGAYLDLFDGRYEAARVALARFRAEHEIPYVSRAIWLSMAEADVALFEARLTDALELSTALVARARAHRLDRVPLMFCYFGDQQARVLAQRLLADPRDGDARKRLRRWIRLFRRGREPLLQALAATHRANLHELADERDAAQTCWAEALRAYEAGDMPAHAAAIRMRLANYVDDSAPLLTKARAYFERERVGGWRRFVELFAPSRKPLPR